MASRRGGYSSLPIDAEEAAGRNGPGAEQQQGGEAAGPPREVECTPEGKGGSDAPKAGASGSGGGKDSNNTTAAEKSVAAVDKTDLTGGLPTAEGVFVGDPVTQSTGYHPVASGGGGGAGGFAPSAPQATVITAAPPPTYQNHVVAAAAVAAMGGDGRGIAVPASGGGHHTVIVMNGPPAHQFGEWGRAPQPIVCRACGYSGLSAAHSDPCSNMPILAAACCCLIGLWPCSFIPFLIPDLRDTVHRCPNCQLPLGRSRQFQ